MFNDSEKFDLVEDYGKIYKNKINELSGITIYCFLTYFIIHDYMPESVVKRSGSNLLSRICRLCH